MTRLCLYICLDMKHGEWLLHSFFAEDVWELSVYLHIEKDLHPLDILRTHLDGRSCVNTLYDAPYTLI